MHRFGGRSAPADGSGAAVAGKKVYTTDCEGNVVYSSSSTNDKGEYTITYTATIDDNALYSVGTAKVRFDRDGGYAASSCEYGITVFAPYYTITYDANTAHGGMAYYGSWTNSDAACKESTAMTFSCLCSETSKFSDGTGFIAAVRAEFTAMLNSSTTGYVNGTASDENFIPIYAPSAPKEAVLYRVWHLEEQFTVSFDTAGGSAVDAQTWKKSSGLLWAALAVLTGSAALAALTEKKKRHGR